MPLLLSHLRLFPSRDTLIISKESWELIRKLSVHSFVRAEDFARRYIWPHASVPNVKMLIDSMNTGSHGRFTLEEVENHTARRPRITLFGLI